MQRSTRFLRFYEIEPFRLKMLSFFGAAKMPRNLRFILKLGRRFVGRTYQLPQKRGACFYAL